MTAMYCYQFKNCARSGTRVGVAQYAQQISQPLHTHTFTECVYMLSGKADHFVDGVLYHLEPGSFLMIEPGKSHSFTVNGKIVYADLYIDGKLFPTEPDAPRLCRFYGNARRQVETLIETMYQEYIGAAPLYEKLLWGYCEVCLLLFRRETEKWLRGKDNDGGKGCGTSLARRLQEIADIVRRDPGNAPTLETAAREMNYSNVYLSRKFHDLFGVPYSRFVYEQRFDHVVYQLCHTDLEVNEILENCGISDVSRFYRDFKKRYGMTPVRYRSTKKVKIQ